MASSPIEPGHSGHNNNTITTTTTTTTSNLTDAAHPPTATRSSTSDSAQRQPAVKTRQCRYFNQSGYCRNGDECPFLHDGPTVTSAGGKKTTAMDKASSSAAIPGHHEAPRDRRQAVKQPPASRVVTKPVPHAQTQDPREFQLGQIRRRFSPKESRQAASEFFNVEEGTLLQFNLAPSDPDFPFDITALECGLSVPNQYPRSRPSLRVLNKDIPRGFAANIESGFLRLAQEMQNATLLDLMKALDKNLEIFLSAPKAETIKILPNKDTRHLSTLPSRSIESSAQTKAESSQPETKASQDQHAETVKQDRFFTPEQKAEAAKTRGLETRQLEARMGRLPLYKKSSDGIAYTVPIEPRKPSDLPSALRSVKAMQLFVPLLYPLEHCRIKLEGVQTIDAEPVEKGFEMKVEGQKNTTLMGHINYLAQNMHHLAKTRPITQEASVTTPASAPPIQSNTKDLEGHQDPERSHIQYISRPLEWTMIDREEASDTDSDDSYAYDTDESSDEADGGVEVHDIDDQPSQAPVQNPERGTAISFPFIELHGIELLEVVVLNTSVKCERCKEVTPITGLKNGVQKTESCKKCATPLSVTYRSELVHAHSVRAGFLDLDGCTIVDLLPSTFIPTCSRCSTPYPAPGIISIRGETTRNVCRECHQTFTFLIPEIKFLRITASTHLPSTTLPRRRKKEILGLVPGTELPRRGRCKHYTKSYRWFRFSCCQKVYACDKCHDEEEEHEHEWANRMICGWCSREQNYRPEDCGVCHGVLVGKRGGGFWEGGKGTRDRVRMSRKDKRKFRRVGGTGAKKE